MQSDGLYRFVVLRSNEVTARDEPADPFINAYGSVPKTVLLKEVAVAMSGNDLGTARSSCQTFLDGLQLPTNDPWDLVSDIPLKSVCSGLGALVRRGSDHDAVTLVTTVLGAAEDNQAGDAARNQANFVQAQADLRGKFADLLLCQALLPGTGLSFDSTAQIILTLETITRLGDRDAAGQPPNRLLTWRIPLSAGRVYLPIRITSKVAAAAEDRVAVRGPSLHPAIDPQMAVPRNWIGDLILMRQQVRGYLLGEIAHVENVLIGESFRRMYRTVKKSEQTLTTETDTTHETERDLQTTTRDELRTEIQKALTENLSLSANFNVQASYNGGTYSVVAGAGGSASYQRASEERESTSSDHAHEVVDKAVEHITERVHTVQESMSSYEEDDVSRHTIDNSGGLEHIVGVYRWLEKQVDLHLINYGRRLIYELMIPEPATFWRRLVTQRGDGSVGPPPTFPQLPPEQMGRQPTNLAPSDFSLRNGANPIANPARWDAILQLAGQWGVSLDAPPTVTELASLSFSVDGNKDGADPEKPMHRFNNNDPNRTYYYESPFNVTSVLAEKLTVPDGYLATGGDLSLAGWMYVHSEGGNVYQYERGYGSFFLGGEVINVSIGVPNSPNMLTGGTHWALGQNVMLQTPLSGELTVAVTTNLNGLSGAVLLECIRTPDLESVWAQKNYAQFTGAYQAQLDSWSDAKAKAALDSQTWAGNLPSDSCRAIEKCELKRGVIEQFMLGTLDQLGNTVLSEPLDVSLVPSEPVLTLGGIGGFTRDVAFFEEVFDWQNISYIFAEYIYGRRREWANLALGDDADAQFKTFLNAGAARVQVPVRPGYETHAEYFFKGLGRHPLDQRIPWLGSMNSIAEDLAAEAREGFVVGPGTISVTHNSTTVSGTGTIFKDPDDVSRELRITGSLYIIGAVTSSDEIELVHPYARDTANNIGYETGGIVVGPPIELSLPTTLVAIDKEGLILPTFPPRYV